ncbi:hypothetical protein [Candidatus Bandiella euplotis]|uniref:GGDEF domain-containing protein n=1 Tax=Candidatus Bandiella euplotis TaxID=1664265 RepID=A0ABZ0UMA1_9RICK|nr:hypothetical protein [Candidatus Bandiella woodruffii]WPX96632.1 hypothetical protein Bandiella_00749 [Candidatus Bandiella woodruffii]
MFKNHLLGIFSQIATYCLTSEARLFQLGVINIDNFAIIEQHFDSQSTQYIGEKIRKSLRKSTRDQFFLQKLDYNSYVLAVPYENHKYVVRLIEKLIEDVNLGNDEFCSNSLFFLVKIGLAQYSRDGIMEESFNCAQIALFECRHEKNNNYSFYDLSLARIQKQINYTDLLGVFMGALKDKIRINVMV